MRDRSDDHGAIVRVLCTTLLAVVLSPFPAGADDPNGSEPRNPTPVELAPIQVEAERAEEKALVERSFDTPDDVAGFGETIFAEPTWRSFQTPAELLGESVGAQIRRQGGRDDFSTLTIRGAPAAQVRILLDGVALGRASDSVVNLADLPVDLVDRIEVYRGFSPVSLTPVSAAGVVNVVTRDAEKATASAAIGAGSFETAKVNASGAGPVAGGSAAAFASYRHTKGNFDYVDDHGTLDKRTDDTVHKRKNNDADAVENLLRWRRGVTDATRAQLRNHFFYKEEGVPGLARVGVATSEARLETVREIAAGGLASRDGRWNTEQIVTWERKRLSKLDPALDNTGETTGSTTAARWGRPLGKANWLSGSGEYTWEGFDQSHEDATVRNEQADRSSLAIAAGDDWTFDRFHTTLSMQLRHQELWNHSNSLVASDSDDRSTDPRLGLRWEPLAGFAIKSNVSTYFRPPNFDELYGTDGFTTGNPYLKPETGTAWDAGFEWKAERDPYGKLAFGYSYFGSNIDDMIIIRQDVNRRAKAFNESKAEIRGHEFRAEWSGPWGLALSANYTHQDPRNKSDDTNYTDKELAGIAPNEGWARLSWAHGSFVVAYDVDVTGAHFTEPSNVSRKLPSRTAHGVSIVYGPFLQGFRLTIEGENLGNSLVPDEIGFPLPGRAFYATLSWSPPSDDERTNR